MAKANRKSTSSKAAPAPITFLDPALAPDRYALLMKGDCMAPLYGHGTPILVDRREPYEAGDLVVLYLKPEAVKPGHSNCMMKRFVSIPPWVKAFPFSDSPKSDVHAIVIVEMLNPERRNYFRCADILAVHRCLGAVPAGVKLIGPLLARVHGANVSLGGDISRRNVVMNALVGAAATLSATPIAAAAIGSGSPDAELIDLVDRMLVVAVASDKATIEFDRVYGLFLEREPKRPSALRWSPADPVSYTTQCFGENRSLAWCDPAEIEALRGKPMLRWSFLGTDEQYENCKSCCFCWV